MPIIKVRMEAFANGDIREVEVPDEDPYMSAPFAEVDVDEALRIIFHYGQNDIQSQDMPSISVGDVILFDDDEYRVEVANEFEEFKKLCKRCRVDDQCYSCYCDSYNGPEVEARFRHSIKCERCE